jgi:hypothetical protein
VDPQLRPSPLSSVLKWVGLQEVQSKSRGMRLVRYSSLLPLLPFLPTSVSALKSQADFSTFSFRSDGRSNPNLDPTPRPSLTTASTSDRPLASDTTDYEWKPPSLCPSLSNIHSTFSPPQLPPQPAPSPSLSAFLETAPSTRTASTSRPKPDLKSKIHGLVKTLKRKASRGTISASHFSDARSLTCSDSCCGC